MSLGTVGYERNQHRLRCTYRAIRDPSALQDEWAETADRRDQITKDVPVLRFDHLPAEDFLHGVWQVFLVTMKPDCERTAGRHPTLW